MLARIYQYAGLALVGGGMVLGALTGRSFIWLGLTVLIIGLTVLVSRLASARVGQPQTAPPAGTPSQGSKAPSRAEEYSRWTISGLGGRVEHILRLAEQNAETHVNDARREAEAIVAAARLEAAQILEAARTETGQAAPAREAGTTWTNDGTQTGSIG